MSDTDSFIEEVTEEVRRDQFYAVLRRYGWIALLVIALIVGGAGYAEWRTAQARAAAETLGDAMLAALALPEAEARTTALSEIDAATPGAQAVLGFLTAEQAVQAEDVQSARAALDAVAQDEALPLIYRQIAAFKALGLQADTASLDVRREGYEALAQPGVALRLLAEEQLALLDIEAGKGDAAIDRLNAILADSEVTADLQQRVVQVIVALGGTPDFGSFGAATAPVSGN